MPIAMVVAYHRDMKDPLASRPDFDSSAGPRSDWTTWRDVDAFEWPAVSVIVPASDGDDDLDRRLSETIEQTLRPHEVLVVDTSGDGRHLSTVARFDRVECRTVIRYVHSPLLNRRALRLLAARLVAGNVKAFAWSRSALPPTWVESIAASVRRLCTVAIARA
jgi:hypothetical protein